MEEQKKPPQSAACQSTGELAKVLLAWSDHSLSDPFNNPHSLVEKPIALACFETTPHPAHNSAKNFPSTRTGGDCLLSEGRGRYTS